MIIDKPSATAAVKPDKRPFTKGKNKNDLWYCKDYNSENGCTMDSGHMVSTPKGDLKPAWHMCAKCWKFKKVKQEHSETASECPFRQ